MTDPSRIIKDRLYAQVSRMGKAISSPKRLELIEILCQGEKTVEALAADAQISVKLASAHLKELRQAQLVETRRDGKYIHYRVSSLAVGDFWVALRALAEDRLVELQLALAQLAEHSDELSPLAPEELLQRAARGEVVVIDVRPREEYDTGHLPHAQSMPLMNCARASVSCRAKNRWWRIAADHSACGARKPSRCCVSRASAPCVCRTACRNGGRRAACRN
jgi:DNA-binding transcriptional ArsR family regulator